ncbi:hypothetical protein H1S01_04530 [Heliobacterium chlorum]|uniref:Uncharacterized protein n=1 Tax=Heliobacterium chlorum TaxID=2698 RepID=A0ABR7T0R4_HELCL|nr:hypothetical protein [Heliobacterium chlorum]MBC9783777.1 hypothetical protein [Heliobacterium chlorum]
MSQIGEIDRRESPVPVEKLGAVIEETEGFPDKHVGALERANQDFLPQSLHPFTPANNEMTLNRNRSDGDSYAKQ